MRNVIGTLAKYAAFGAVIVAAFMVGAATNTPPPEPVDAPISSAVDTFPCAEDEVQTISDCVHQERLIELYHEMNNH